MCIFCKIINNEIPSYTIYEDDTVKCLLDVNPIHNGHALIIPKKHFVDITDIDEETLKHIATISKQMYKLLKEKLDFTGLKVVQNNGSCQDVKHYHMHLIPTYAHNNKISIEEIYNQLKN